MGAAFLAPYGVIRWLLFLHEGLLSFLSNFESTCTTEIIKNFLKQIAGEKFIDIYCPLKSTNIYNNNINNNYCNNYYNNGYNHNYNNNSNNDNKVMRCFLLVTPYHANLAVMHVPGVPLSDWLS